VNEGLLSVFDYFAMLLAQYANARGKLLWTPAWRPNDGIAR
jgi:hypothetical protein